MNVRTPRLTELVILAFAASTLVLYAAAPRWIFAHLSPAESTRFLLFLAIVGTVFAAGAATLIESAVAKLTGKTAPLGRPQVWLRRTTLALAAVGILCIAYGYFVEPYWLEIVRIQIKTQKLAKGARPIRIVHVSDFHSDAKPRLEERLPDVVAGERPDIIVFTGDAVNSPQGLPVFRRCLTRLAQVAPTFVVEGNFDSITWRNCDPFGGTGARELDGQAARVKVGETEVWIAGAPVTDGQGISQSLKEIPSTAFTVFLFHTPDVIEAIARERVDLFCAGHTHGGQIALPFYGALVTLSEYGKRFEAGLHRVGDTWIYVNRGIGMEGGTAPRVRFWARPEVTVIEVVPAT